MENSSEVQPRFFLTFFAMRKILEIKDNLQSLNSHVYCRHPVGRY